MGQVRIDIRELGAIKHSKIALSSIMFFSGESGLGKSYLALLCHYFFDVLVDKNRLNRFFLDTQEPYNSLRDTVMKSSDSGVVLSFRKKNFEEWLAEDLKVYMRYMMNHATLACDVDVHLPGDLDEYVISYRSEITGLEGQEEISYILSLGSLSYRVGDADVIGEESPLALLMRHHLMLVIFGDYLALQSSVILPPSRGAVFTEDVKAKTGLFARFIERMSSLRRISEFPESDNSDLLDLFSSIIQGKISTKEEAYYHISDKGLELPLSAVASSIREIAPLSLIISRLSVGQTALLFEEPEAHLHPMMQRKMADLLMLLASKGMYMQITTHSDHILRRINEHIALLRLKEKMNESEYQIFLEENQLKDSCLDEHHLREISSYLLVRREDGSSKIIRQDVEDGIPYKSFVNAARESLRVEAVIEDKISEIEDESAE